MFRLDRFLVDLRGNNYLFDCGEISGSFLELTAVATKSILMINF
jgi:hypothetical protein